MKKIIVFILLFGLVATASADSKCKYYITGEDRTTMQFYVEEDWPIVKQWNIQLIWVDTNAPIVGIKSGGVCGVMRFKTTIYIDKQNFRDCEYVGRRLYDCDHFDWTLNHELERKK
jgi:hypothetical protein